MIIIGDFSDEAKQAAARRSALREMKQILHEGRKKIELEKIVFLLDKQDYELLGRVAWR